MLMKTTNFALQQRKHFKKTIVILGIELIIFGIWVYTMLSPENISVSETMGHVMRTLVIGIFLNLAWLYFIEDRLFFNKYAIMNKLYKLRITIKDRIDYLKETLEVISKDGKPIFTPAALDVWETLPMADTFDQIVISFQEELNILYDKLTLIEQKESFFFKTQRQNLWMYFKSKVA